MQKKPRGVLSFGAGINSTALLVLAIEKKLPSEFCFDTLIFADTRSELPETYEYIRSVIIPACSTNNFSFIQVSKGDLLKDYSEKKIIPFRLFRSCTDKYKIRPMKEYAKKIGSVSWIIGIDYGEKQRAKRFLGSFKFPLIEMKMNRSDCEDIIRSIGWKIPVKSGCFFCPFTPQKGWVRLLENHRDLFLKAEEFEKNSRKYPKFTLTKIPLEQIRKAVDNQQSICQWIDETEGACIFCHS